MELCHFGGTCLCLLGLFTCRFIRFNPDKKRKQYEVFRPSLSYELAFEQIILEHVSV